MCRTDKYPASISKWGLTDPVDAAFLWENGFTYFFRLENNRPKHLKSTKYIYRKTICFEDTTFQEFFYKSAYI
jgi:hypothetical protein